MSTCLLHLHPHRARFPPRAATKLILTRLWEAVKYNIAELWLPPNSATLLGKTLSPERTRILVYKKVSGSKTPFWAFINFVVFDSIPIRSAQGPPELSGVVTW